MFENTVLRRIFGSRRDEVTGKGRQLHNEELNDLYSSPYIARVVTSRRMRWAVHVEYMGRGEAHIWFRWGNLRERNHVEDPGIDGRIILKGIFRKWDRRVWIGLSSLRIGTGGGLLRVWERTFGFHKAQGI